MFIAKDKNFNFGVLFETLEEAVEFVISTMEDNTETFIIYKKEVQAC